MSVTDPATVVRIAARGEGVTADGRFVPFAAPGDRLRPDGSIEPGPDHAVPQCPHFTCCGGCQLQHVSDSAYAAYLNDRITGALAAQGIGGVEIRTPHLSPPGARRRVAMHAVRRGQSMRPAFTRANSHQPVEIDRCPVMRRELEALLKPLADLLRKVGRSSRRVDIQMTCADQGVDVTLRHLDATNLAAREALTMFAKTQQFARLSLDDGYGPSVCWEPEPVTVTLGGVPVTLPEGAFLQATADGERALVAAVRDATGNAGRVADLFAGLGTFALSLSGSVHAVEGARDAVLALAATRRVAVEHRDLFRRPLTAKELASFDAVVLDPPRAGARDQVAELARSKVARIACVSCNPATFARDASTLIEGGYRLAWIQPVGQFLWSTHVELAAAFTR